MKYLCFLVLFHLLFSCSNESDNNSIAIELQQADQFELFTQNYQASNDRSDLEIELKITKNSVDNEGKIRSLNYCINKIDSLDTLTDQLLEFIEVSKIGLIKHCGEKIVLKSTDENYTAKLYNSVMNIRDLNLSSIVNKDNHDKVNSYFYPTSNPSTVFEEQLNVKIENYTNEILSITGNFIWGNDSISIDPKILNSLDTSTAIIEQLESKILMTNDFIPTYLFNLSNELAYLNGLGSNTNNNNLKNASIIEAISILTSIQSNICRIRKLYCGFWRQKMIFALNSENWIHE